MAVSVTGDAFMVATLLASTRLPREWAALYSWPGHVWFGLFFYLIIKKDPRPPEAPGISRRMFVARVVAPWPA